MRWSGLPIIICLLYCLESNAQIRYTRDFTTKLRAATLALSLPDSTWYNVVMPCEDKYNQYDLCLISEVDSAELRFIILDDRATRKILFPEMHYMARLSNLASNDENHWMRTKTLPSKMVIDSMKADWAGEMSFTPKSTVTDKRYGKLFSIYRENTGMVFVLLFYNYEFPGFNDHLHSVYFNLPKPNTNN